MDKTSQFFVDDQLKRLDRTIERLADCNAVTDDNFQYLKDAFIEFCIHCYQLKDIVAESGFAPKAAVESFVSNSRLLTICGNVANKAKHHKRRPGSEPEPRLPRFVGELLPIVRARNPFVQRTELHLEVDGRSFNCLQFTHDAREEWKGFINKLDKPT